MENTQADTIIRFLKHIFKAAHKKNGVIAISGGIDSALSLTLTTQVISPASVYPILLPYGKQSIEDSALICKWNHIPKSNIKIIDIKPTVDLICKTLKVKSSEKLRRGNIMARVRMIMVYDLAKEKDALVIGTENKSEKYLGYFTRFGDEASDIEPLQHLYKTEVRALASELKLPEVFLSKSPSAGLWESQTDEEELGFTYAQADQVIAEYLKEKRKDQKIKESVRKKVLSRISASAFKHEVPYTIDAS